MRTVGSLVVGDERKSQIYLRFSEATPGVVVCEANHHPAYPATTYDLATHGTSDCYGTYDDSSQTNSGAGYVNSCIHSGTIAAENTYAGVATNTVWYNYVAATAGTIKNKDTADTTGNLNTATESLCPKGWTLPSTKQIDNNRSTAEFSPVRGGNYNNGMLNNEDTHGFWWGSTAYNGARRYILYYGGDSSLYTSDRGRYLGLYIRCVSEEKTVTDLTYMQECRHVV